VPALADDEVHVWRAELEVADEPLARLRETLTPDERERAERFAFEHLRRHFVAGRGILRSLLAGYLGRPAGSLRFSYGPHGKPALAPGTDAGVRFNVSHSHGLALYAVARGRDVGVDVERIRPEFAGEPVAQRFFSAAEVRTLQKLPAEKRHEAFFACWARKEAFLKATGRGLRLPLDSFDVSLAPGEPAALLATRPDPAEAGRWSLRALDPGPGYAGAVTVLGQGWKLWLGHWLPRTYFPG
jgi:4'-phosphopantetheinyl transferase